MKVIGMLLILSGLALLAGGLYVSQTAKQRQAERIDAAKYNRSGNREFKMRGPRLETIDAIGGAGPPIAIGGGVFAVLGMVLLATNRNPKRKVPASGIGDTIETDNAAPNNGG